MDLGVFMASSVIGAINNHVVTEKHATCSPQWSEFWLYPAVVALIVEFLFWIFFKDTEEFKNNKMIGCNFAIPFRKSYVAFFRLLQQNLSDIYHLSAWIKLLFAALLGRNDWI